MKIDLDNHRIYVEDQTRNPSIRERLEEEASAVWDPSTRRHWIPWTRRCVYAMFKVLKYYRVESIDQRLLEWARAEYRVIPDEIKWLEGIAATRRPSQAEMDRIAEALSKVFPTGLAMFEYQLAGVAFVDACSGRAFIGDAPGLGKTVQAIGWLALHPEMRPALVVVPAIVRTQWGREIVRWGLPAPIVVQPDGDPARIQESDIVVISYDGAVAKKETLYRVGWKVVIADEAHMINNWQAQRTKTVRHLAKKSDAFIALSGTPVVNKILDVHGALRTIDPKLWPGKWDYGLLYGRPRVKRRPRNDGKGFLWYIDHTGASNMEEFGLRLSTTMIRRMTEDVQKDLPERFSRKVILDIDRTDYEWAEKQLDMDGVESSLEIQAFAAARIAVGKAKVQPFVEWMQWLIDAGEQVVVFTQFHATSDAVAEALGKSVRVAVVDGRTTGRVSQERIDAMMAGELDVLVAGTRATGIGVNLTRPAHVVILERDWTSVAEEQAIKRVHRYGQTRTVTVWYMHAEDTIDVDLEAAVASKAKLENSMDEGINVAETAVAEVIATSFRARHDCKRRLTEEPC